MAKVEKLHQNAAGIDIGSEQFFVSTDGESVKVFETFTSSIEALISYLGEQGTETIAMEATGVLWVPLYDMLEHAGFEVYLVNGAHARNVPGQKSDPFDCRWLQQLHTFGLLRASFIPEDQIRLLRNCMRLRSDHIQSASGYILQMQKAFELMNIKLHEVIDQLQGVSGMRIIKAILSGERNAEKLLALCHTTIRKNKKEKVLKALQGNYKKEYLFLLQQALDCYEFFQIKIQDCDRQIEVYLKDMTANLPEVEPTVAKPARHNDIQVTNFHNMLVKLTGGKNATELSGISDKTYFELVTETGTDLARIWPTKKHFTSWTGLAPRKNQSGKINKTKKRFNPKTRVGQIFRTIALSVSNSKNLALRGFYNRIKSRHGAKVAMKALARKIAELYYNFMTKGMQYVEQGIEQYERNYRERVIKNLNKRALEYGFTLTPC
jgi:transposase